MHLCGHGGVGRAKLAVGVHPGAATKIGFPEPLVQVVEDRQYPSLRPLDVGDVGVDGGHHAVMASPEERHDHVVLAGEELVDALERQLGRVPQFGHADSLNPPGVEDLLRGIKQLLAHGLLVDCRHGTPR